MYPTPINTTIKPSIIFPRQWWGQTPCSKPMISVGSWYWILENKIHKQWYDNKEFQKSIMGCATIIGYLHLMKVCIAWFSQAYWYCGNIGNVMIRNRVKAQQNEQKLYLVRLEAQVATFPSYITQNNNNDSYWSY